MHQLLVKMTINCIIGRKQKYLPRLQEVPLRMSAWDLERWRLLRRIGVGTRRWCASDRCVRLLRKRCKNLNDLGGDRCSLSNSNTSLAVSTSSTSSSSEPGNALYTHDCGLSAGVHNDDSFSGVFNTDRTRSSQGLAPNGRSSPNERELAACECKFVTWCILPCEKWRMRSLCAFCCNRIVCDCLKRYSCSPLFMAIAVARSTTDRCIGLDGTLLEHFCSALFD